MQADTRQDFEKELRDNLHESLGEMISDAAEGAFDFSKVGSKKIILTTKERGELKKGGSFAKTGSGPTCEAWKSHQKRVRLDFFLRWQARSATPRAPRPHTPARC